MKIACVGDTHGSYRWKEALDLSVDRIVFMGDYVDSYVHPDAQILQSFQELLEVSRIDTRIDLLLGNHDLQYLLFPNFRCGGFRATMQKELTSLFQSNQNSFQLTTAYSDVLFSHAGISSTWISEYQMVQTECTAKEIATSLNDYFKNRQKLDHLLVAGRIRGGQAEHGGPVWCDYNKELIKTPYKGIRQVFGHTQVDKPTNFKSNDSWLLNVNYLAYTDEDIYVLEV